MANQMIALQARGPQLPDPSKLTAQYANMLNMTAQRRTAERHGMQAQQQMDINAAEEARAAALHTPALAEAGAKASAAELKTAMEFNAFVYTALSDSDSPQQVAAVADRIARLPQFQSQMYQGTLSDAVAAMPQDPEQFMAWKENTKAKTLTAAQQAQMSGERHGAIRIGRPDEYRWVGRFFAAFGLEPHNYYDLTKLGAKSQPIIATAFRARRNPEHRIFCSLLMTDYFAPATRAQLEAQLATREIFSAQAKALIEQHEQAGGLTAAEATQLIAEGVQRIFKWTGRARNYGLYQDLCAAGFKIAADVVCFESHHLNHLTPNTLWLDLYFLLDREQLQI